MSEENVEIIRQAVDAFNDEDFERLAEVSDDDLEFVSVLSGLVGGVTYKGRDLWAEYFAAMHEAWAEWQAKDLQVFDAGDDQVASLFRLVGTGRQSGVTVERPGGMAYWLRNGKMWRVRSYFDPAEALEAVGLRE